MASDSVLAEIRRHLEAWCGYPDLAEVLATFSDLDIYIAGGVVRNSLLRCPGSPKDFDFFLRGPSVQSAIERISSHGAMKVTPFGAPRWYPSASTSQYADIIPIDKFSPGLWPCENIVDVLNQFDFTANAVAFDLRSGEFFNPQNGARDARHRVMRMVRFDFPSGPYVRSGELDRNAILWFRVVHYASTLGFRFEDLTKSWVTSGRTYVTLFDKFSRLFFEPDLRSLEQLDD